MPTKRVYGEARARANKKYNDAHYWKLTTSVPKELEAAIRRKASDSGLSVNAYIISLIKDDLGSEGDIK